MNFKKQPLFPRRLGLPVGISRSWKSVKGSPGTRLARSWGRS
jgi:hypothetical protein